MDVLVEFVIWLLKTLFGEHEEPADMTKRQERRSTKDGGRGPYSYGDESAGSNRPKTLEQILAEVRREAAQRGSGAPPPQQRPRPQQPPSQPQPPARTPRRLVQDAPDEKSAEVPAPPQPVRAPEPIAAPAPATAARKAIPASPTPERMQRLPRLEQLPRVSRELVADALPSEGKKESPLPSAHREAEQQRALSGLPPSSEETRRAAKGSAAELARSIRRAPQSAKLVLARQAVVVQEIFGPPRSRRPFMRPRPQDVPSR